MLKRTITAVCIATVLIPLLLVGQSTVFFPLLFTFISVVAEFEPVSYTHLTLPTKLEV